MPGKQVIPHTRDCSSHWDGECSCAPDTRDELQQQIDYLRGSQRRWQQRAEEWYRQRDEARKLVKHLVGNVVECWSYRAELAEAYPWITDVET